MIAKVSGLAKVGLSVAAGLLGLTVLMTVLAAAGSEAGREGESLAAYSELLGASSVATLTLTAYPTSSIVPDGIAASTITATLRDGSGNVVTDEDTSVIFLTTLGFLGSQTVTKTTETGVATAELKSHEAGVANIVATAALTDLISVVTQVTFSYGAPTTVTVGADPTSIRVGGYTSTITATVQDELGGPIVDGTVVTFGTLGGSLDSGGIEVTKTTTTGVATAELTSDTTAGNWLFMACCDGKCDQAYITFIPGDPYTVTVVADPTSIPIDGYTSTIEATVVDQYGNLVAPVTVTFTRSLGTIFPLTDTTSNGEAFTTLTSGSTRGTATVTATADSKAGNTSVTFVTRIFLPLVMKSYTP